MFWFADKVNSDSNAFYNKVVKLTADIDLESRPWDPVGKTSNYEFRGTFDGYGHTISNLKIEEPEGITDRYYAVGLFGWVGNNGAGMAYVKNLTIDGAEVSGGNYVGAIAGYVQFGSVENCTVKYAEVTATHTSSTRCGAKAGAVIGHVASNGSNTKVYNCKAEYCNVKGARDVGQVIGCAYTTCDIIELSATEVTVGETEGCDDEDHGQNINAEVIGRYI